LLFEQKVSGAKLSAQVVCEGIFQYYFLNLPLVVLLENLVQEFKKLCIQDLIG